MTQPNLYDALEICLQMLERGGNVESCLARYPGLAEELRPILAAAVRARSATAKTIPVDVIRRSKSRVLQAAAEMREEKQAAILPFWRKSGFFGARFARLAATSVAMIVFLLSGGTGLVNASTRALPGDQLYPVKRSWEGVRLVFVIDQQKKNELENEFDHERVQEIEELYSEKRIAQVNFQGIVQEQKNNTWVIGGLNVRVEGETIYTGEILPGAAVQVVGETDDEHIKARRIILLATPGVTASPFPSSTAIFTESMFPGTATRAGNDDTENFTPVPEPSSTSEHSSEWNATSTPRAGNDSEENNSPSPTTKSEATRDGEHHKGDSTPRPTEEHREETRTPRPTESH